MCALIKKQITSKTTCFLTISDSSQLTIRSALLKAWPIRVCFNLSVSANNKADQNQKNTFFSEHVCVLSPKPAGMGGTAILYHSQALHCVHPAVKIGENVCVNDLDTLVIDSALKPGKIHGFTIQSCYLCSPILAKSRVQHIQPPVFSQCLTGLCALCKPMSCASLRNNHHNHKCFCR